MGSITQQFETRQATQPRAARSCRKATSTSHARRGHRRWEDLVIAKEASGAGVSWSLEEGRKGTQDKNVPKADAIAHVAPR